jgi:serine/threonine-protein kinase
VSFDTFHASPLVPGYRLDRYELLCPIAEGGMASVWIARLRGKHGFEKLVAIKTILPKYASDVRFQKMFLDEARIASRIEHVNVAQILDLGEERDVLFLAMEWVDGDALSKLQRALERAGVKFPLAIALRILADACGGLHAAHELRDDHGELLNVVHRDVSPQNILVSTRGVGKLIDFGVAKARDRIAGETNTGFLKGKIQYMAPEQALGLPVDRRADVWALGAILYHLLAGKPPFEGQNQLATLHLLASGGDPEPLPPSVPAPIAALCARALAHSPEKRFESAHALLGAIEAAMRELGMMATASDVAAFFNEHMAERNEQRKLAIELALKAAEDRARVQELLRISTGDEGSGSDASGRRGSSFGDGIAHDTGLERVSARLLAIEAHASERVLPTRADDRRSVLGVRSTESEPSMATDGSATLDRRALLRPPLGGASRTLALGFVAMLAVVAGTSVLAFRAGSRSGSASHAPEREAGELVGHEPSQPAPARTLSDALRPSAPPSPATEGPDDRGAISDPVARPVVVARALPSSGASAPIERRAPPSKPESRSAPTAPAQATASARPPPKPSPVATTAGMPPLSEPVSKPVSKPVSNPASTKVIDDGF